MFGFISVQRMMGVGGGRGGVDLCKWGDVICFASNCAFISKDFFDFLPKSKKHLSKTHVLSVEKVE